jgi:hypothetical protein
MAIIISDQTIKDGYLDGFLPSLQEFLDLTFLTNLALA